MRDTRPPAGIREEVEEGCGGLEDGRESRGVFVKEFVPVSGDGSDEEKEGEVEREDVGVVYGTDVDDIPEGGDDEMSHEHESEGVESDAVPDAHSSWNVGAEFNLGRLSLRKVKSGMTNGERLSGQTLRTQTT